MTGLPQELRRMISEGTLYTCNHVIAHIPSHTLRLWFYRHVMGYQIAGSSYIFMGAYFDCKRGFKMGSNSIVNQNCRLDPRGGVEIGNYVSLSAEVCILTADHDPQSATGAGRLAPVSVEDYAFIGTRAMILRGVTVGRGSVVAAGAVVVTSIPPYTIVAGCPAKPIGIRNQNLDFSWSKNDRLFH